MLKWLSDLFTGKFNVKVVAKPIDPISPTVQEDPRTIQKVQRTREDFKKQEVAMTGRARVAHSAACKDPVMCMKKKCFKWAPDKIVSKPYELDKEQEETERRKRQKSKGIHGA
jgi:hypothetical protein